MVSPTESRVVPASPAGRRRRRPLPYAVRFVHLCAQQLPRNLKNATACSHSLNEPVHNELSELRRE